MDQTAAVAKQKTFEESPAKEILAIGGDAKIELIRNITQDVDLKYGKLIMQTYRVTAADQKPIDATLTIARSYKEDLGKATWIVANIEPPPQ